MIFYMDFVRTWLDFLPDAISSIPSIEKWAGISFFRKTLLSEVHNISIVLWRNIWTFFDSYNNSPIGGGAVEWRREKIVSIQDQLIAQGIYHGENIDFPSLHVYFKEIPLRSSISDKRALTFSKFCWYSFKVDDSHLFLPRDDWIHDNSAHEAQVDCDEAIKGAEDDLDAESLVYQTVFQ